MSMKIEFVKSVFESNSKPKADLPEIALCGRSNVGKSSFINSLFNRKNLAKTSSTPGKTRSINYYNVDDTFYLVDLPGFGYAKVSKEERNKWDKIIQDYFTNGRQKKLVIHFIDSRHKPTNLDIQLYNYLGELPLKYFIILSKSDKLKQSEISIVRKEIGEIFPDLVYKENFLFFSAVKGTGKKEVMNKLKEVLSIPETSLI
jgi:GTP-binding protein